jgi:phosphatidylglycerol:prolipoprotein diacylglycerol transferase
MLPYPKIDPNIITIGPIQIRWYGVMYILGMVASYLLIQKQERARQIGLIGPVVQDLIFYLAVGLIVGARIGYVLFYQYHEYAYYLQHPVEIIATWHGGMSFHGGLAGAVAAGWWFCRRRRLPFAAVADAVIVTVPVGLGLGRIGNFINGELYGRPTDVPWAMIFPGGGPVPRHPSQLYEALLEGLVLFILLWLLRQRAFRDGMMVAFFVFFYGLFRSFVELFREPDVQLGFVLGPLTMGQLLSLSMMAAGLALAAYLQMGRNVVDPEPTAETQGRKKATNQKGRKSEQKGL